MKFMTKPGTLVLAALIAVGALAGTAASQAVFAPAKIAFVDIGRIYKEYGKVKEIEQKLTEELRRIEEPLRARFNELKKRRGELEILLPGTAEFRDAKRELDREAFLLEWDEKDQKEAIRRTLFKRMSGVYTEIQNEAENFARRTGVNAVFMVNTHKMKARNEQELQVLIASRPVIFWDKALDLTDEILRIMDGDALEKPAEKPADDPKKPADEPGK